MGDQSRRKASRARCLHVLAPELPWRQGEAELDDGQRCPFVVVETRGGVSQVRFEPDGEIRGLGGAVADWMVRAGSPPLTSAAAGDAGRAPIWEGPHDDRPSAWPAPFRPDASSPDPDAGCLAISRETVRALRSGHPWILRDAKTGVIDGHAPGAVVRLVGPGGRLHGLARVDDDDPVVARLWSADATRTRDAASVEARVADALSRRSGLAASGEPWRALHGEADGLPGLHADVLGSSLRVQVTGRCALPLRERVVTALRARLDVERTIEVIHLRRPPPGRLECVRLVDGPWDPDAACAQVGSTTVEEQGLRFRVDLGLAQWDRPRPGVGFFLDQREARREARRRARPGGRYLNLFAHTGSFSAVLLAAGAASVVSVDLSAAYLAWLDENLTRNGLADGRHQSLQRDVRSVLDESEPGSFDGIVLDPPTAAAAGRRFLATRRDLGSLVESALRVLRPGGWLYVSRNDRRGRGRLRQTLEEASRAAGSAPVRILEGAIPEDFPILRGFPEGDPFEAWWLERGS